MASVAVVGAFDPGDDLDAKLVAGCPGLAVEDVLLEKREERFHGGVDANSVPPRSVVAPLCRVFESLALL